MLYYLKSPSTDPYFNLALEQYVFDRLDRRHSYLMLWQNDNTIVVGKYQNTYREINREFVDSHGIRVVRRLSGGGTVYHDLGNLNYTIITDAGDLGEIRFDQFCRPIVELLQGLGVPAELQGRNDMTAAGRKFSGNAQYVKQGRVMHHGTLMFSSDLSVLGSALQVSKDKIESKGIASVRSRVCNLGEYLPAGYGIPEFERDLVEKLGRSQPGGLLPYVLDDQALAEVQALRDEVYARWDWNYGRSPACSICKERRIPGVGKLEIYLELESGRIKELHFRGDYFSAADPEELSARLLGCPLDREALEKTLADTDVAAYFRNLNRETLVDLLLQ